MNKLRDSGEREIYTTGASRDAALNKGRFDLLPAYAIFRVAQHFEAGAQKYEDRNWERGMPLGRYLDSALRHIFKLLGGWADEDHAAAAAWNVLAFIETQHRISTGLLPAELDDLPAQVWIED